MGINGLLKNLPGDNIKISSRIDLGKLSLLCGHPVDINTGMLIYICALRHKAVFNAGNYLPAADNF